jgi:hypothetical protein
MAAKRIGVLFGMEDTFPWALMQAIDQLGGGEITGVPVDIAFLADRESYDYALILDRISHEVPFYRTFLKAAVARGTQVVNNPFWGSADDKYFGTVIAELVHVAAPRTVLLPHKHRPPNTEAMSFRNLRLVDWDAVFGYLGFPIFLKPAYGGGWKDVYKCDDPDAFFAAYDSSRDLTMMAQEAIDFTDYYRCYVIGRERVHIMPYDPRRSHFERYVHDAPPLDPSFEALLRRDALALSEALGYDMNTVELAVRDGIPYAIDFTNPAPDADLASVGSANFAWVVENMAATLVERVRNPRPVELTGSWPAHIAGA